MRKFKASVSVATSRGSRLASLALGAKATQLGFRSPVPHLLGCNDAPTDAERLSIHAFIELLESAAPIAGEPPRREPRGEKERSALIHAHINILSITRTLPFEIIQDILLFAVDCGDTMPVSEKNASPWNLSQVCQGWRVIAFATPALWNNITVNLTSRKDLRKSKLRDFGIYIQQCLDRAGTAPLHVSYYSTIQEVEDREMIAFLRPLFAQSERWVSLNISGTSPTLLGPFQEVKGRLPHLRILNHDGMVRAAHSMPLGPLICNTFESAPLLRTSTIKGRSPIILLPWTQMKHCTLVQPRPANLFAALRYSTNLEYLSYKAYTSEALTGVPEQVLTSLVHLELSYSVAETMPDFFRRLSFPVLETLVIESHPAGDLLLHFLTTMFIRHPVPLQNLTIRSPPNAPQEGISDLLGLLPLLEILYIRLPDEVDLSEMTHHHALAPRLKQLVFEVDGVQRILSCQHVFRQFVHSRCSGTLRLFAVTFPSMTECYSAHATMERLMNPEAWSDLGSDDTEVREFLDWRALLLDNFPEIVGNIRMVPFPVQGQYWSRIDEWFRRLETIEMKDVRLLYISSLHIYLRRLAESELSSPDGGHKAYKFEERAQNLVDKWMPALLKDVPNIQWAKANDRTLEYIPSGNRGGDYKDAQQVIVGRSQPSW